jgi:ParB family chromosome partitioning protein
MATPQMTHSDTAPEYVNAVPIAQISESKTNPRKHFDKKALQELASSIAEKGIVVPLLVRSSWAKIDGTDQTYEIVAGARRFRAAQIANLAELPVIVRELSDDQVLEIQVIENLQRADVHPLEEANGYKRLLSSERYTDVAALAAKVGKSESYVYQRLKLAELIEPAKKAFFEEQITAGHAILIARLQPQEQKEALAKCIGNQWSKPSVRELSQWIQDNLHLDLAKAPWQKDDADLLPKAGACTTCPKRTGATPALFPDVTKGDTCTDPACYQAKLTALVELKLEQDATAQLVSTEEGYSLNDKKALKKRHPALLMSREYRMAGAKKCPSTKNALVVEGNGAGTFIRICVNQRCKIHRDPYASHSSGRSSSPKPSKDEIAKREKEKARKEIGEAVMVAAMKEASTRKPEVGRPELERIAASLYWQNDSGAEGVQDLLPRTEPKWAKQSDGEIKRFIMLSLLAPGTSDYANKEDREYFQDFMRRQKIDLAAIRTRVQTSAPKKGTCRYCHCTEKKACKLTPIPGSKATQPCSWIDATKTVCSNPTCVTAAKKAKAA